jgi:uncharacterized Tic20 family protein
MENQPEMTPEEPSLEGMSPESPAEENIEKVEEVVEPVEEAVSEPPAEEIPAAEEIPYEEIPPAVLPPPAAPFSPYVAQNSEDRTWSMLAHLSVLLNLVTGILGPIVAIIIYFVYKDKSKYIAYQSMQSFVIQLICWVGGGLVIAGIWIVTALLSVILVGLLCIPFSLILTLLLLALPLVSLVYGVVAAIETSQGKDFRYLWVGDWVRGTLEL